MPLEERALRRLPGMPQKWTAEGVASGAEDFEFASGAEDFVAAAEAGL